VWAAGWTSAHVRTRPLVERWDGTAWTHVPAEVVGVGSLAFGISVAGADAWIVGTWLQPTENRTLVERYDGIRFERVPWPNPSPGPSNSLQSVVALPSGHVWAVGTDNVHGVQGSEPLVVHACGV
jgi:hypothetical protein